ncbi:hypothetical protein [Brevundimonas sp.]|uniref:hypothetical protein n=1 Tax=Brevundimonas sp. TaxID=1871086 RepID=UPI003D6CBD19
MLKINPYARETRDQLMDGLLADIGTVWRRGVEENLTEADFSLLMRRMRDRASAVRDLDQAEDRPIVLTDAGLAALATQRPGRSMLPHLVRRLGLMTGRQLAAQTAPNRMRHVHGLGVIDGGRA